MGIQRFYEMMLGNLAMGLALIAVLTVIAISRRHMVGALFEETDRFWHSVLVGCVLVAGGMIGWITFRDSWLQLVTEPYRLSQRWEYQRTLFDPVASDQRQITLMLSLIAAVLVAALFARYVGGYALQLGFLIISIFGWFALFIFRQRFDMIVNTIPKSDDVTLVDIAGFTGFWLLRTSLGIVSIAFTAMVIVFTIAPLVTVVLDLLKIRTPRITNEAKGFFAALERTAAGYDDTPLAARWKPIRPRA